MAVNVLTDLMDSTVMFSSHACDHEAYHSAQSGTNLSMLRRNLCQFPIDYMASHPKRQ